MSILYILELLQYARRPQDTFSGQNKACKCILGGSQPLISKASPEGRLPWLTGGCAEQGPGSHGVAGGGRAWEAVQVGSHDRWCSRIWREARSSTGSQTSQLVISALTAFGVSVLLLIFQSGTWLRPPRAPVCQIPCWFRSGRVRVKGGEEIRKMEADWKKRAQLIFPRLSEALARVFVGGSKEGVGGRWTEGQWNDCQTGIMLQMEWTSITWKWDSYDQQGKLWHLPKMSEAMNRIPTNHIRGG